jgi:hypothetical protein
MTKEKGAAEAGVKIRVARFDWMWILAFGGIWFAATAQGGMRESPEFSTWRLVLGFAFLAEALWVRSFGIDLTRESAIVRGVRRRSIPWQEVQAVLCHSQLGSGRVSLVLENGTRLTLRAPTTYLGIGRARYERDFHRIGQWWLAHRGESWRPARMEAPWSPVQGSASSTTTGT